METVESRAEQRVLLRNISWETYERLLDERGDSRVPRLAYDRGDLEIMSPSSEHESVAYFVALLVAVLAEEMRVNAYGVGSTTYRHGDIGRGFEPDASFYIRNEERIRGKPRIDLSVDPPPDWLSTWTSPAPLSTSSRSTLVWASTRSGATMEPVPPSSCWKRENTLKPGRA
jgi:Uma2 family endonuclease